MEAHAFMLSLHAQGIPCGQKRVARLMRELGISAQRPKHRTVTTHSEKGAPVAANLLQQDFHADRPNQKWTTDTTYIWTKVGWLYLAVVLDLFSLMVVGESGLTFAHKYRPAWHRSGNPSSLLLQGEYSSSHPLCR